MCLGAYGYGLEKSKISEESLEKIKHDLTVETQVLPAYKEFQKPQKYRVYSQNNKFLFVPRYYGLDVLGPPQYQALAPGRPMQNDLKCIKDPMPHQQNAITVLDEVFQHKPLGGGGILSLPCGYGKTYCAIRTACRLGVSTLVVVPTECLMDQWLEAIIQFVPNARVDYIQRDHVGVTSKGEDFVVAMLHSICLKEYPMGIFDNFGLAIFDECHHLSSKLFCQAMIKIRTKYTLGLSATPRRRDGLANVFHMFLGPLLHKERRSGANVILVKQISLFSDNDSYKVQRLQNGNKNTSAMVNAICNMVERNNLLVWILRCLVQNGRRVLLLSARKKQLRDLKTLLDACPEQITSGFYYGKPPEINKENYKKLLQESAKCSIVLGIDVLAKEGLDIPDRDTLVWASPPGEEIEQPVGRILRRYHSINPLVIDLVDQTGNFPKHSQTRNQWFLEEEYPIHEENIQLNSSETWHKMIETYLQAVDFKPKCFRTKKKAETEVDINIDMYLN
jgi:superfamily II DNA or RNA helicase